MNSNLFFSVVIPTYHRNDLLAKCLDCLAPDIQTLPAEQYEVIITDDGSDTTAEKMIEDHYPWAKWIPGKGKGPATNRNNGAKYAQGEWLVFTDDDCLPDPQWLEAYAEAMVDLPDYQVFEGRTYVDRPRKNLGEVSPINETGGYLWSCNFVIQRQLFESINGFDERFPYAAMEDVDLNYRLKKAGYKSFFVDRAAVCHPWRNKGGWRQYQKHRKSTCIYLFIHPEELKRINSQYYIKWVLQTLKKETVPGIFKYKGSGFLSALLEHFLFLQTACVIFYKYQFSVKNNSIT